ncbi:usherin [Rhinophrynus dorsalis]
MEFQLFLRELGALIHVLETLFLGYSTYLPIVSTQGYFPKLENVGAFKPVTTTPGNATCGLPERSVFCHSDTDITSLQTCIQRLCIQDCPFRSASPTYHQLLLSGHGSSMKRDRNDLHPGSYRNSTSYIFYDHKDCFVTPPNLRVGTSFTLTVWLKPEQKGVMCVIEKSSDGQIVFRLTISEKETVFHYRTVNGLQPPVKVMTQGRFLVKKWIHLTVQVHHTRVSFFFDGLEDGGTAFDSRILSDPVFGSGENSSLLLGQNANGLEQFVGRMQDFRLYQVALTNREIVEVYSKDFPYLHLQSECHCPSSHPRVHPASERYCIANDADDTTKDQTLRLNPDSHPLSYINDNDLGTTWISSLHAASDIDNGITITFDLANGQYQVFYVILEFYSPLPEALKIQRRKHRDSEWENWQYLARDCQYFGMENNGHLEYPDSVNCQQLPKDTPYSRGNVTISILTPEPNHRPGYNDFYNTQSLQEFVKVTQLRIQLIGQYYTELSELSTVNFRHRYYGIDEVTISGRCNCHGHARSCDKSVTPYRCLCDIRSHTDGDNCDRCLPLFNEKPFHQGDQVNAYDCRPCQCNNHAYSCHYNITLDPYPHDHHRGGGGVCNHCLHNTTGKNCELCKDYFYREIEADITAIDVCKPCDCNEAGTVNQSLQCEKIGGQCKCKTHVFGRQCDQCRDGFYNLQKSDSYGCLPCDCNTLGTLNGDITCHQNSGQCNCKPNVIGLQCNRCNLGFKQQKSLGTEICVPCDCIPYGSINQFCNPTTGQCKCREHVKGLACDTCIDNYYGLDATGCKHCDCYMEGISPGSVCDPVTGQCACQPNIGGRQCNECLDGFYKVRQNNSLACFPCNCDISGTINSSQFCDKSSGQCLCKAFVTGQHCNICMPQMFNLTTDNLLGCQECDCDPAGTLADTECDQINGQCKCRPNYQGRRCNQCMPGFYVSNVHGMRCASCSCHPRGSVNEICDNINGQCICQDSSVTGQNCDKCSDSFFGFDSEIGRCRPCNCNAAGATNGTCHSVSGQCLCKLLVRGLRCDQCVEDASNLDISNPYGCSTTPYQQPPPKGIVLNSTAINLTWNPPDSPNTNRIHYVLYRDGLEIYNTVDYHPYSRQSYTDKSLSPYTAYYYYVEANNVHGFTSSTKVMYKTKAGVPEGVIHLSHLSTPYSTSLNWTMTSNGSGPIEKYMLMYTTVDSQEPITYYEGLDTSVTVYSLKPFTKYNFSVHACTIEGCIQSLPLTVITPQAPPAYQSPPVLQNSSSTSLNLQWIPPSQANGIIIGYELYMRVVMQSHGNHSQTERRVFYASGWLSPLPVVESENENALLPPATSADISNLEPNTEYEFCIVTTNMAGSTPSEWVTMKTAESAPLFMPPPMVFPLSSNSLNVSWEKPDNSAARGKITGYTINIAPVAMSDSSHMGATSEVLYVAEDHEYYYIVAGLKAYHTYTFTITLCNKVGCITSGPGVGQTLPAAPGKLNAPLVEAINSTVMKIAWTAPGDLNGPSPSYQLERIESSLTMLSHTNFIKGTRFPGHGYFKFPPSTLPANTYFTGIKIKFRTKEPEGLILCAVSAGMQEEYIALQIRNGRPYFLFDPQGSAVAISPRNDGGRFYNDNEWHEISATRNQGIGIINLDGQYTGTSEATSGSTIIGENTGVFVGGFPDDFIIKRNDKGQAFAWGAPHCFIHTLPTSLLLEAPSTSGRLGLNLWELLQGPKRPTAVTKQTPRCFYDLNKIHTETTGSEGGKEIQLKNLRGSGHQGDAQISLKPFVGCLGDIFIQQSDNPHEIWEALEWDNAEEKNNVFEKWEGCPDIAEEGAHFLGFGFLELYPAVFPGGPDFELSFMFKTDQLKGLLLFIYNTNGPDYFITELNNGILKSKLKTNSTVAQLNLWAGLSYCDGRWNQVYIKKERALFSIQLNNLVERVVESHNLQPEIHVNSSVYIGGVPEKVQDSFPDLDLQQGFGGCMKDVRFTQGVVVNFASASSNAVRVNLDGCLSADSSVNCRGNDSIIVYSGKEESTYERDLQPFTEYLYRVTASNEGGSGTSVWSQGRTRAAVPQNVQTPLRLLNINGYSAEVIWARPTGVRGVIEQYVLNAYPENNPGAVTVSAASIDTSKDSGTLKGLLPFTKYTVTLSLCTLAGCSENSHVLNISTLEEALATFTPHQFLLTACTLVGCTNSSQVTLFTAQLPPDYVSPPILTILDSTTIYVQYVCTGGGCTTSNISMATTEESSPDGVQSPKIQSYSPDSFNISWSKPVHPNGIIRSYGLYMNGILMQNSSHLRYFVDGLYPWSKHSFRLQACTAKGCALSKEILQKYSFSMVSNLILKAGIGPQGDAMYIPVALKGIVVLFVVMKSENILFTPHLDEYKSCGEEVADETGNDQIITDDDVDLAYIPPPSSSSSDTDEAETGDEMFAIINSQKILHSGQENNKWISVMNLVPFSNYSIYVNASNSQGSVISDLIIIAMPPGAPDGVLPPRLSSATPTSLQVVWSTPVRNNAPGLPNYRLQMRFTHSTNDIIEVLSHPTTSLSYRVTDLQPFTLYELSIIASNRYGETKSNWAAMSTKEDKPGSIDPPVLSNVKSRSLVINWQHPPNPNGVIIHYNIYQNGSLKAFVPGNSTHYTMLNLNPYTKYLFQVEGCTSVGCSLSMESLCVQTHPDVPSHISPPDLYSDTPTSVIIKWQPPLHPNGIIANFTIERRIKGTEEIYTLVTLPGDHPMQYLDETIHISPWSTFEYRIKVATHNGGTNSSDWSEVTTRPSRPGGVQPPEVTVQGPYSVKVIWKIPLIPNGDILSYEIRMPEPQIAIINTTLLSYTVTNLIPYTNYSVTIVACSGGGVYLGGCTESLPTYVTTHPTFPQGISPLSVTPISETFIAISWQPPSRPNGPHLRYELLRRKILQPLASNPPEDLNRWQNIYSGTQWFYGDKGLSRYTTYEYRLIVHNIVGYTPSADVTATTMAGPPVRGSNVTALAINHTAIKVEWTKPTLQDLQGDVELYTLFLKSSKLNKTLTFQADANYTLIGGLYPNTVYELYLQCFNGAHSIISDLMHVTTLDGEPEGIFPPEVVVINGTAVRVIWSAPSNPNGVVTEYSIYVNNKIYKTGMNSPGSFILAELFPFTVYNIQVEVCTVYACVQSNSTQFTTVEGEPSRIPSPTFSNIGSRSVRIDWTSSEEPNGIILGFDLRRRTLSPCSNGQKLSEDYGFKPCSYLKCRKYEDICGDVCYNPNNQECCNGVLNIRRPGYECCEDEYMVSNQNSSLICCGGEIYVVQPEHQCCGRYYTRVKADEICCYDPAQNSVSIGYGDSCCGGMPFLRSGSQICCGETLYDSFNQQCCGGKLIGQNLICCGDKEKGSIYTQSPGMFCCGTEYVNISESICCSGSNGKYKVHLNLNNQTQLKCCETELIPEKQACYTSLDPFTTYEYRVSTWNHFGHGFSSASILTTKEDKPQGVSPPRWDKVDSREDLISLTWDEPSKPNGIIHYVLLRDGIERYRGKEQTFQDKRGISPFKEYAYQISACTVAGCSDSTKVMAAIKQGVPEDVTPPLITPVNSTALHLSWTMPKNPNGNIREYQIHLVGEGLMYSSPAGRKQYTVTGLKPFTNYSFVLTACTSAGCNSSEPSSSQTLQDAPQGVWLNPSHVTINESVLELYWSEPEMPNGIISQYRLIRNREVISTRSGEYLNFTDAGLQPNSRYFYQLEASTEGGSNRSEIYVVETPGTTPKEIPVPFNVTVLGPRSLFAAWDVPGVFNSHVPLEFNVLLSTDSMNSQVHPAGRQQFIIVEDLNPYTWYDVRIQACQNGNCGAGIRAAVRTDEAAPEELDPPHTMAIGPNTVLIKWRPPKKPNGIITRYIICRRLADHEDNVLLFIWSEGNLEYIDSSNDLQPYTAYEYQVTAQNSRAAPEDMKPPDVQVKSAYSVFINWSPPAFSNGIIKQYCVKYQEIHDDPTSSLSEESTLTVPGTSYQAIVFGLLPATKYQICIEAINSAGKVASPWISVQTLEASPSGLANFTVEKKENGRELLLKWPEPLRSNGRLQMYNIFSDGNLEYSGLSRQFLFRRLDPYTIYQLVLEACTEAGCTRTFPQLIQTEEASPTSQLPPLIHSINSSHIELSWSPPIHPNGKLKYYNIIKRCTQGNSLGNKKNIDEKIVYTENNTESKIFSYIDEGLRPWTNYEYKIRTWNSVGYTDSSWTMVQTSQAAPSSLLPPKLSHVDNNPHQLNIQWTQPEEENGVILSYRLQRNNIILPFSFDPGTFRYTDEDLMPYSEYNYSVIACTLGGCATSDPAHIKTLEAAPALVSPPNVESLSTTEINVTWSSPLLQNGEITKYIIQMDNENYFAGNKLSKLVSNLQPFTWYNISLLACTNGGCTSSLPTSFKTMEAPPTGMKAPTFDVTGAESVKIKWQIPDKPNGEIRNYELRRDDILIYVGSDTHYHDFGLMPGMEYSYTIQANNNQGSCISSSANIKTHPSSPSGLEPPKLQAKSAHDILVIWKPPLRTNGDIINYTLSVRYPVEMEVKQYSFNNSLTPRISYSFLVKELKPCHQYEAKVEACTLLGCTVSEWATGFTLEAPPELQPPPLIDLQTNPLVPLLFWTIPEHPNGNILRYELYRRKSTHFQELSPVKLVYNGSSTSFQDVNLLPYTEYEYQLWAVNSAGQTPSTWTSCRTGPAPPEGIHPPTFDTVSSTQALARILPPTKPNGIVTLYRLFSSDTTDEYTVLSEGTSNTQIIYGLKPFTNYSVGVEVCTCIKCCSRGPLVQLTTRSAPPSHQLSPRITSITSRSASFHWNEPESPNGIIQSYEVYMQITCPHLAMMPCTPGPIEMKYIGSGKSCNVTDLQPYTHYSVRVVSYNSVGSTASEWITCTTQKEKPTYTTSFHVSSNITTIFLDWSLSFQLNGHLKEFVLTERGQRLYSGLDSIAYIQRTTDKTFFFQVTCTTDMGTVSSPTIKYNSATGLAPVQPFPSAKNGTETRGKTFYTELWFIILMALLGLLLLAIFLSLVLQKKLSKQAYPRERPPLVPVEVRMSSASGYTQNDTYTKPSVSDSQHSLLQLPKLQVSLPSSQVDAPIGKCEAVADMSGSSNRITLKSYITHTEGLSEIKIPELATQTSPSPSIVRKPSQSQISHSFSQNSLYRSASQFISSKKSLVDSALWDNVTHRHDSGMYVDDEDLISTIKSFSTVTKQHTAFTDTPL